MRAVKRATSHNEQKRWIAAASDARGQRSHSLAVSNRNTSSLARSGNIKAPAERPDWGPKRRRRRGDRIPFVSCSAYRTDERTLAFQSHLEAFWFRERPRG